MPISERYPFLPRLLIALLSTLLVSVVGMTFATAQSSEPVSTGVLTATGTTGTVSAGDEIQIRGAGYAPGGQIDVTIESDPVLLKTVRADAAGTFEATVTIPAGLAPGDHTLKATGPHPVGGLRVLSVPITVASSSDTVDLARTGSDVVALVIVGAASVLAGGGILAVRRRRA